MLVKEIGIFNHYRGIEALILPDFTTKSTNPKISIDFLTESLFPYSPFPFIKLSKYELLNSNSLYLITPEGVHLHSWFNHQDRRQNPIQR